MALGDSDYRDRYGDILRCKDSIVILLGIIDGIEADRKLVPLESKALKSWLTNNARFSHKAPFSDIHEAVANAIEDEKLEQSEIDDIRFVIDKALPRIFHDGSMVYLQGLITGFAADGDLNEMERQSLKQWLLENEQRLSGLWPFDELFTLLFSFKKNSEISPEHMNLIKSFMNDFMSIGDSQELRFQLDPQYDKPLSAICATAPVVEISERKFCLTGKSLRYRRSEIFDMLIKAGGIPTEHTAVCDYLVVCPGGSGLWVYQAYGRKIEHVLERRKKGQSVSIILEKDLLDAFPDYESA